MAYRVIFKNYPTPLLKRRDVTLRKSFYTHPFFMRQLLMSVKGMRDLGMWKNITNDNYMVIELKGVSEQIYLTFRTTKDQSNLLIVIEGQRNYLKYKEMMSEAKPKYDKLPILGYIQFTSRSLLEKEDKDMLKYLNVTCRGKRDYPKVRGSFRMLDNEPSAYACIIMARACECAYRMFKQLMYDSVRNKYKQGLYMYQKYNADSDRYEYKYQS